MKPNFMIAGVAKCGTTSLSNYLEQHPMVCIPKKETFFFIRELYENDPSDLRGQRRPEQIIRTPEAYTKLYKTCKKPFLGEVSTCYLYYHALAIPRIKEALGDIPIAIIIRHPVKRVISGYRHFIRLKRENLSFEESLKAEAARKAGGWDFMWQYRELGLYAEGIKAFQDNFSKVKVITQDALTDQPKEVMQDLFRFFGMDDQFVPDTSIKYNISDSQDDNFWFKYFFQNETAKRILKPVSNLFMNARQRNNFIHKFRKPSNKPEEKFEISREIRDELNAYFREDILKTMELTGLDLQHWLK